MKNKLLQSESGQALIEYVLLLIIILAVFVGVIYQFNDAFRIYAKNYFGDYVTCLLETGELPTLGGAGSTFCADNFENFSLAKGRAPKKGSGSGGSGSDGSSGGSDSGNGSGSSGSDSDSGGSNKNSTSPKKGRGSANSSAVSKADGGSGNSGRSASRFRTGGGSFSSSSSLNGESDGGSSSGSGEASGSGNDSGSSQGQYAGDGGYQYATGGRGRQGQKYIPLKGKRKNGDEYEKARPNKSKLSKAAKAKQKENEREAGQRFFASKSNYNSTQATIDETWDFGDYLRYLLIGCIIIATIAIIGSQIGGGSDDSDS